MTGNKNPKENLKKGEAGAGKILHTYASDLASAMKQTGSRGAFVKGAIAESREREEKALAGFPYAPKNIAFTFGGFLLIIAAIVLIVFSLRKPAPPPPPVAAIPIIVSDQMEVLLIDLLEQEKIAALLGEKLKESVDPGAIKAFRLARNNRLLSQEEFLRVFAPSAPGLAAFTADYLLGEYGAAPNKLFILLKASQPFDFRLQLGEWEEKMLDDLYPFFGLTPSLPLLQTRFASDFIVNREARVIKFNGEFVLGYAYFDGDTIAIATDLAAFAELNQRFLQEKIRQ